MVQRRLDRLEGLLDLAEVHHPAGLRIDRPGHVNVHAVVVAVEAAALVPGGRVGQRVGRLETKRLDQLGLHLPPVYRKTVGP